MREQTGYSSTVRRRASATQAPPASRQYAGHFAGNHPEDAPYMTGGHTRRALPQPIYADEEEIEEEEEDYVARPPSSSRRYLVPQEEVYTQGNRRIVVHRKSPPAAAPARRFHWMLFLGISVFVMVIGWIVLSALGYWWQQQQDTWKYGDPRTFQVDQFVGHGDSTLHPNHFIAINTGGMIEVVELNVTTPKNDHVYPITTAVDHLIPVSINFQDINHDGKLDMLVTIGDGNPYTVIFLNTGMQFAH